MPHRVQGNLYQMKTNVIVPLSNLANDLRLSGGQPDPRDADPFASDNHVFDALLEHIDRKRRGVSP